MLCGVNMRATAVVFTAFVFATALIAQQTVVPDPPEARDQLTLTAAYDADQGHNAFFLPANPLPQPYVFCLVPSST